MKKMSILDSILESINQINWKSETHKSKAISLCKYIYSLNYKEGDFHLYRGVSSKVIEEIIKTKQYVKPIIDELINNNILMKDDSYRTPTNKKKGIAKGYKFSTEIIHKGNEFIMLNNLSEVKINKQIKDNNYNLFINNYSNIYLFPIADNQTLTDYIYHILNRVKFNNSVYDYIYNYQIKDIDVKINKEIEDDNVSIIIDKERRWLPKTIALNKAKELGVDLIQYRGRKCYFDTKDNFTKQKNIGLKLLMKEKVFDINNKSFYGSRNETNNRFDYNLTNMKGELIKYLELDGEQLVELDIANAQFAILSYITDKLDEDFIELCQSGTLYEYLSERFNITRQEAKDKMFRVSFDKRKRDQDDIRNIFPLTMSFIDTYKGDNGYKFFSNLLQKTESLIMIDGLLNHLMSKGYEVLPIHDAMRVKESQANEIQKEINNYFESIKFKCNVRIKNK